MFYRHLFSENGKSLIFSHSFYTYEVMKARKARAAGRGGGRPPNSTGPEDKQLPDLDRVKTFRTDICRNQPLGTPELFS